MDLIQLVILAIVQALTEFLPVSSSGHLGLAGFFFGWEYQGVLVDLMLHFGTLIAVLVYFRRDLGELLRAGFAVRPGRPLDPGQRLALGILVATVPAVVVGVMLGTDAAQLRHPLLIAAMLMAFGLVLGAADRFGEKQRGLASIDFKDALLIGAAQALALIPGVSRSGICITAGLLLGLNRECAARYAFLLAVPITVAACLHGGMQAVQDGHELKPIHFLLGIGVSALFGMGCIHLLLGVLRRFGTAPFVAYRLVLGVIVVGLYFLR
ncbi:MAG TPA: undecaprenyl-diphosphate phosphatase [Xanthomonadaceae bacterium]|nr:undecaprenyl-diphosphate phosphatase [Xanthomonadaceae bacterium]